MVRLKVLAKVMTSLLLRCFNSNMVRLKVWQPGINIPIPPAFQFQYGSIKREPATPTRYLRRKFQFQYGSIKSECLPTSTVYPNLFQFQYGSIKSWQPGININIPSAFQFQYGSIKRIL